MERVLDTIDLEHTSAAPPCASNVITTIKCDSSAINSDQQRAKDSNVVLFVSAETPIMKHERLKLSVTECVLTSNGLDP